MYQHIRSVLTSSRLSNSANRSLFAASTPAWAVARASETPRFEQSSKSCPLGARLADQLPFLPVLKLLLCLDLSCFVAIFDWFSSDFPSATTDFSHNFDQSNHQLDNWNMSKAPIICLLNSQLHDWHIGNLL